ncbi:MAG: hypothetical protein ABUL62_22650 [Myxococcales bacterium]
MSAAAACTVGGVTVSLGGGPLQSSAGAGSGGDSTAPSGSAGLALGGDTGDGGLMVTPPPVYNPCNGPTDKMKTTISGTVWDPKGEVQMYNAVVYVPKEPGPLPKFQDQVACEWCTDSVAAQAVTLSGPDGSFVLKDTLAGNVDLVVQVGKWRRKQTVDIKPCQDNPIAKDKTRLPRSNGEGDIPKIAVSTGHSDALECLLRKIGIDDSEFTTDAGDGRVNMFVGCEEDDPDPVDLTRHTGANHFSDQLHGGSFPSTNRLFDAGKLNTYDVLVFSCEGHKCDTIQTQTHVAQLVDFANHGGRVFLGHDHYNWLNHANVPIESAAQFSSSKDPVPSPLTTKIDTSFPKGAAFAAWLKYVNASTTLGALDIYTAKTSVKSLSNNRAQQWIYRKEDLDNPQYNGFFYFTIGTPVAVNDDDPAPKACGRVVFTDLHLSNTDGGQATDSSDQNKPFPDGCTDNPLTAQEKALEFMFFDLTSCVQQEDAVPTPPVVK